MKGTECRPWKNLSEVRCERGVSGGEPNIRTEANDERKQEPHRGKGVSPLREKSGGSITPQAEAIKGEERGG